MEELQRQITASKSLLDDAQKNLEVAEGLYQARLNYYHGLLRASGIHEGKTVSNMILEIMKSLVEPISVNDLKLRLKEVYNKDEYHSTLAARMLIYVQRKTLIRQKHNGIYVYQYNPIP